MARGDRTQTSAKRIALIQRANDAIALRIAGVSYDDICTRLKYKSRAAAHYAVKSQLKKIPAANAEEYRKLNTERLNNILSGHWLDAIGGKNPDAAHLCIKIIKELNDMMGVYSPILVNIEHYLVEAARARGYDERAAISAAEELIAAARRR